MSDVDQALDALLKNLKGAAPPSLLPGEFSSLVVAFLPSQPHATRSKAFITLSAICQAIRHSVTPQKGDDSDPGTDNLVRVFTPVVTSRVSDVEEHEVLAGVSFLSALFQVDWQSASVIFKEDGVAGSLMDALDMFPSSADIRLAVAHLLAQASGHKACRSAIPPECISWLEKQSRQTSDPALRAGAAIALVKVSRGTQQDLAEAAGSSVEGDTRKDEDLVQLMKGMVIGEHNESSLSDAIEGLAYMSVDPATKETLATDDKFLKQLFSLAPRRPSSSAHHKQDAHLTLLYGITMIIANICAYRPRLSEEQKQMDKLRKMANSKNPKENPLGDDDRVRERCLKLVKNGALDALTAIVRATDSRGVRLAVGRALLYFVEDKENRGKVLQSGGAKALMVIIRDHLSSPSAKGQPAALEPAELEPIQALAKLAITASPFHVFGPNEGALYDAIRPLSNLLSDPSSNSLQRFEAMMALTNLASQGPEVASRIAVAEGLMNKLELLLLDENHLVQRAATELLCNLVAGCESMFDRYSESSSKMQVLVALADVDDLHTRLAASGALATLTASPTACRSLLELENERHRVMPVLAQLVDPSLATSEDGDDTVADQAQNDPGLVHRGVVCIRNFLLGLENESDQRQLSNEAEKIGLVRALVDMLKRNGNGANVAVLRPTAEALKVFLDCGIQISG
ncbi:hypothetical protein JAAARDRAFT_29261 [Jaapia argillacea MUCL 33604]|uniref:UNC-45/Cro1/She4 central domain-containing protein n=1 Tax=Jaapia argillacea MUCL 33604 TaxID=933084 RepID=A0A067QAP7_9AGAM|nr:hypothetical protein JAAARDRAFT_29261 [Jaapia argillacea MUCL 33604]